MKSKVMQITSGTIIGLLLMAGSAQFFVSGQELKNKPSEDSTENSLEFNL